MKKSLGYNFVEILIALFILSAGLLSMAEMSLRALQQTQSANWRSIAIVEANSLSERLLANKIGTAKKRELQDWQQQIHLFLPQGHGVYQCQLKRCCIIIKWSKGGQLNWNCYKR